MDAGISGQSIGRGHHYSNMNVGGFANVRFGDTYMDEGARLQLRKEEVERQRRETLLALAYEKMSTRRNQLARSTASFLEWIWEPSFRRGPGFVEWLQGTDSVFWITGKPGSGKSTLVRYLTEHGRCEPLLEISTKREWLILHFFFDFRAGSTIPNSLEGMFRCLLLQLVQMNQSALSAVQHDERGRRLRLSASLLDTEDLRHLLRLAIRALEADYDVCSFIDGLDEFSGSHLDLVRLMDLLVQDGLKKLCVASRPEAILNQKYRNVPSLKMQDHNTKTIWAYVRESFEAFGPEFGLDVRLPVLMTRIVKESQGVILWADLVTRYLVDGIVAGETEEELLERLEFLPDELDELYERTLSRIDNVSMHEAALMIHLIRTANVRSSLEILQQALRYLYQRGELKQWPKAVLTEESFALRLRARTVGLVDITNHYPSLYHKTFLSFLRQSTWIEQVLLKGSPPLDPDYLWLRLCSDSIISCDSSLSVISVSNTTLPAVQSRFLNEMRLENHQPQLGKTIQDQELPPELTAKVADLSKNCPGGSLLENALKRYLQYLKAEDSTSRSRIHWWKDVMGCRLMIQHYHITKCLGPSVFCKRHNSHKWAKKLSSYVSVQRAFMIAFDHGLFQICLELIETDSESLLQDHILRQLIPMALEQFRMRPGNQSAYHTLQVFLKQSTTHIDQSTVVPLLLKNSDSFFDLLVLIAGKNRLIPWSGFMFSRIHTSGLPSEICTHGYNLLCVWVWAAKLDNHSGTYDEGGLMQKKLQLLLDAGLDINSNCCFLGTAIDTAIKLNNHLPILIPSPLEEQIGCLQRHGARYNTSIISGDSQLQSALVFGESVNLNSFRRAVEGSINFGIENLELSESARFCNNG